MKYLSAYPPALLAQVRELMAADKLGALLRGRYAGLHDIRTDRALYDYACELKGEYMRKAEPLAKAVFDNKLHVVRHALGTHTTIARVQGSKLKTKREIRVASLFKTVPLEWLRMIVVHELAHTREKNHDKPFYALCTHMEPEYHRFEFELRLYLTHLEAGGAPLWPAAVGVPGAPAAG
ncbi:YgjP-like metallopeptidase domain-containing protein [Variovorax boronicumulans]|uniref:YgjP-like metallopeptidase domain-containing protein n=1 Tax=Variovorax boronicumulans TaxID=436515 RepID=UPI0012E6D750|nr:YgjP-like metallopeptidase domain-containing protein [Variovorax boronicumulans]GER09266.1 M48 family peptidase [Variovorax boronicumulans]